MSDSLPPTNPSPDLSGPGSEEIQPFVITLPDDPASGNDWYLWAAVLALIALVAFWPAIKGTFLWDDDQYVTQNRALLDASGLKQIWKIPPGTIQYYPLSFTLLWVEHQLWGNNSLGYRVVNLLLHAGAAVLLWRILRRLSIPGAWAAAAIWAVHPIQAESVCWISECKNVLSGVLALASALFYLEFAGLHDPAAKRRTWMLTEDWQPYAISAGFFLLALLAKTSVVFLPVAVLLILWWKGRLSPARILGTVPMLIIGAALAWETSRIETDPTGAIAASGPEWQFTFVQRLLISGRDFWFYVGKILLPIHQSFVYPRILPGPDVGGQWVFLLAAAAVLIVLFAAAARLGRGPVTAAVCYLLLIFPALGFFNVYPFRYSFVADHFQYLAGIPVIVLTVSVAARIFAPLWKAPDAAKPSPAIAVLVSILLLVLGATAWIRADVFSEPTKLWEDVLQPDKNPQSWLAAYNLAVNRHGAAADEFDEAARLMQGNDQASSKIVAQDALSQLDDSDRLLKLALDNPQTPPDVLYKAHDQAAENDITRMRSPDSDSAALLAQAAEELRLAMASGAATGDPLPYYDLGLVNLNLAQAAQKNLQPTTRPEEIAATTAPTTRPNTSQEQRIVDLYLTSRENFQKAARLAIASVRSITMGRESARILPLATLQSGNIDWTLAALAREHSDADAENRYAQRAVIDYGDAVNFDPNSAELRYRLALALENRGDLNGAKIQLMTILKDIDNRNALAYNEIGRVILESRPTDMAEFEAAVASFKTALALNPALVGAQRNLELAMRMLASTRPSTRATTGPATMP